jgi:hypothetical protein
VGKIRYKKGKMVRGTGICKNKRKNIGFGLDGGFKFSI